MRFKAKVTKDNVSILISAVTSIMKIGTFAACFLDEENVRLAVMSENLDQPKVYAELSQQCVFFEYRIESQSENTILFEIDLDLLLLALTSAKNAPSCSLKLAKRDQKPCLCLETRASEVDIVHDIPIKIMKSSDIVYYQPPEIPDPSVVLELPRGRLMKTVLDRMMKISKQVHITADQTGRLVFRVDHSSATIQTFYNGITLTPFLLQTNYCSF